MTLVYRAIWCDDREDLGDAVHRTFAEWVHERSASQISVAKNGSYRVRVGADPFASCIEVTVETVDHNERDRIDIVRSSYVITTPKGHRWHTLVRSWTDETGQGWCWVDNSVSGGGLNPRALDVISPIVTRKLLKTAVRPRVDEIDLSLGARQYTRKSDADALAELITHFERSIPLVVIARSDARFAEYGRHHSYDAIVESTAQSLAGIAVIASADEVVANRLTEMFGREFGVFNGAFRVYVEGADPAVTATAFRHRYVTADRYLGERDRAARIAGRIVGPESTLRRPPASWEVARERLDRAKSGVDDYEELYRLLSDEYDSAKQEIIALREENVKLLEWQEENARINEHLEYAKKLLITSGEFDDFDDDGRGGYCSKPPRTAQQAVDRACRYLSDRVEIHPEALRDAKMMDRAQRGAIWAGVAWQGFRALYAYADYMAANPSKKVDFLRWCESAHNTARWATTQVAQGESGEVKRNRKHLRARMFPISVKAVVDGEVEMFAHLKIERYGGNEIPRVYFKYSDKTEKVHVGFYGPHKLVPNTKS